MWTFWKSTQIWFGPNIWVKILKRPNGTLSSLGMPREICEMVFEHEQKVCKKMKLSCKPVCSNVNLFMEGLKMVKIWSHYKAKSGLQENQVRFGSGPKIGPKSWNGQMASPLYWACPEDFARGLEHEQKIAARWNWRWRLQVNQFLKTPIFLWGGRKCPKLKLIVEGGWGFEE